MGEKIEIKPEEIKEAILSNSVQGNTEIASEEKIVESEKEQINPEVSAHNFEVAMGKMREIIEGIKGDFVGVTEDSYLGVIENKKREEIIEKLVTYNWDAVYDDTLTYRDGTDYSIGFIGTKEFSFVYNGDDGISRKIFGESVNGEDYVKFMKEKDEMLNEKRNQLSIQYLFMRELPQDIKGEIKRIKFDRRTEYVLKRGIVVGSGVVKFKYGPYGSTHFGSGTTDGSVKAYSLKEWREGKRVRKTIEKKDGNNGFISGPIEATIDSNTVLICRGENYTDDEPVFTEEIYICE